ncbi:MAG: M48 family metalloprotease [Magnetococcales bacterium]|nr:M48 family metalloprotease [Magnetococcales bacterium]
MPKYTTVLLFIMLSLTCTLSSKYLEAKSGASPTVVLITGPETSDFLKEISRPILKAAGIFPDSVSFHVMLDNSLNAMALPSNDIIFNSGLLLRATSRAEVAGVMAHEIAHLSAGHHTKLENELANTSLRTVLLGVAGIAAGVVSGSGELTQASIIGSAASGKASMLSNQRQKETQADRLALYYMAEAGFNLHGLTNFMERILQEQQGQAMPPPYLLSHPLSSTRVMEIRQIANEIEKTSKSTQPEGEKLARVQAKLLAGSTVVPKVAINHFQSNLKKNPASFPDRYGLAVAYRYAGNLQESEEELNRLLKISPNDPYLFRERGRTRVDWGRPAQAESDFKTALKQRPENEDLLYWLAFSLKEQKKYRPASKILHRLTNKYPKRASYFYLLAMVQGKGSKPAAGHLSLGRYYMLVGERKTALWHFSEAISLFKPNSIEKSIASREKDRLLAQIRKERKRNLFNR